MMCKLIIDRFEESFAVCETENGEFINIEKDLLPQNAKAGDVLINQNNKYIIDEKSTEQRRNQIRQKQDLLWE